MLGHEGIQSSGELCVDYGFCRGIHLTDDYEKALLHGDIVYEIRLPFHERMIALIPNTDTGEWELWVEAAVPLSRVVDIHFPIHN